MPTPTRTRIKIGVTGTKTGMKHRQQESFKFLLRCLKATYDEVELHHGDCIGSDAQADKFARELGCRIVIHPPINTKNQANCAQQGDKVCEPKEYGERDYDIVDETEILVATPTFGQIFVGKISIYTERVRSGTWMTIRYARKSATMIFILEP